MGLVYCHKVDMNEDKRQMCMWGMHRLKGAIEGYMPESKPILVFLTDGVYGINSMKKLSKYKRWKIKVFAEGYSAVKLETDEELYCATCNMHKFIKCDTRLRIQRYPEQIPSGQEG